MANHEIDPPVTSKEVANLYIDREGVFHHSAEEKIDQISNVNTLKKTIILNFLPG